MCRVDLYGSDVGRSPSHLRHTRTVDINGLRSGFLCPRQVASAYFRAWSFISHLLDRAKVTCRLPLQSWLWHQTPLQGEQDTCVLVRPWCSKQSRINEVPFTRMISAGSNKRRNIASSVLFLEVFAFRIFNATCLRSLVESVVITKTVCEGTDNWSFAIYTVEN